MVYSTVTIKCVADITELCVRMSYVVLMKEYIGKSDSEIQNTNWPLQEYDLHHPLVVTREILASLLPAGIDVEEISKITQQKQKEIVKGIDVSRLPTDRPAGYIGQIALYKALRCFDFDPSYVLSRTEYDWSISGFLLFYLLVRYLFVCQEMGREDIDLLSGLIKSKEGTSVQQRFDQLWIDRVLRNFSPIIPRIDFVEHRMLRKVLEKLHQVPEWKNVSKINIQKWCNCSKAQVSRIRNLFDALELKSTYQISLKNFGLTHSISKEYRNPPSNATSFMRCTNLDRESTEYLALLLDIPSQVNTPHLNTNVYSLNTSLYCETSKRWTLNYSLPEYKSLTECDTIHFASDYYQPEIRQNITQRDAFFAALLLYTSTYAIDMLPYSLEEYLSHYTGVDQQEVARGIRGIHRKRLLIPEYLIGHLLGGEFYFVFLTQDSSKKIIPYISSLAESSPRGFFRVSDNIDAMHGFVNVPRYLERDFINMERKIRDTYDLDLEMFRINQFGTYKTSALMSLIPNYND